MEIKMVRVPREFMLKYCALPWAQVVVAATHGTDGLSVKGPSVTPWFREAPKDPKRLAQYEADFGVAYLRDGEKAGIDQGRTWLFQENW